MPLMVEVQIKQKVQQVLEGLRREGHMVLSLDDLETWLTKLEHSEPEHVMAAIVEHLRRHGRGRN